jgi:hypothetical protein
VPDAMPPAIRRLCLGLSLSLLAACSPAQIENSLIRSQRLYEKYTDNGLVQLERGGLSGTEWLLIDRYQIPTEPYRNMAPFPKVLEIGARPGDLPRTILLVTGEKPGCRRASFIVSFTRRNFFKQELPGCGIDYSIEQPVPTDRNIILVGRAGSEWDFYGVDADGRIERREIAAIPSTAPGARSAPSSAPQPSAAPVLEAPRNRQPRPARPTLDATPEIVPAAPQRQAVPALPPAESGTFQPGTQRPVYDPTKETRG